MLTEAVLLSPLILANYMGLLGFWPIAILVIIYYWLPKWLMLNLVVERYFPTILTRNLKRTQVALTFDDMPFGNHELIIDILDQYQMKGTFFIISSYVNRFNRHVFVQAIKNGHQIGNHGLTNTSHLLQLLIWPNTFLNEIDSCDVLIKELYSEAGVPLPPNMVYRPGCGLFNKKMISIIESKGYRLALGSTYPHDPVVTSPSVNYFSVINHISPGDVIILHDRQHTPELLERLLFWMKLNNYKSTTISDLFSS